MPSFVIVAIVTATLAGSEPAKVEVPNPHRHFATEQECKDFGDFAHDLFIANMKRDLPEGAELDVQMDCRERAEDGDL